MREIVCILMCVSEVQVEGNVVYSVLCVRYRMREILCTLMCVSEVQGEGNVVYIDVCI